MNGSDAYRDAIEHVLATTHRPRRGSRRSRTSSWYASPSFSGVVPPDRMDRRRLRSLVGRLLDEQIAFVAPTRWHGESVARLAFLHPDTTLEIVDEVLATTR